MDCAFPWDPQNFAGWSLDFHSLRREISQLSPRPASTGQKEMVLKHWWSIRNSGSSLSPLCLETSVAASPSLVGPAQALELGVKAHSPSGCPVSLFPFSHSQHSGHPTLLPVLWVGQDLPASKSWLVGGKRPPSSNRITSIQSLRPYLNVSSSGSLAWFPFPLFASGSLVLYPIRSKVDFNYCQGCPSFLPAISAISRSVLAHFHLSIHKT